MSPPKPTNIIGARVVVGIDVGLTGTGQFIPRIGADDNLDARRDIRPPSVAHCLWVPDQPSGEFHRQVTVLQKWPGRENDIYNKVPTRIAYKAGAAAKKWGFQCSLDGADGYVTKKYFKLFLDPEILGETFQGEVPLEDVKIWFADFLTELRVWIQAELGSHPSYQYYINSGNVEYLFSVPTTWKPFGVVDTFKEVVTRAGFRRANSTVDFTEAEAAAIHTLFELNEPGLTRPRKGPQLNSPRYKVNDRLLVCDAGGGTTDTTILTIKSLTDGVFRMTQHGQVKGEAIGSVQIDVDVGSLITERLAMTMAPGSQEEPVLHYKVLEAFQHFKHGVGTPIVDSLPKIPIQLHDSCPIGTVCEEVGIKDGQIKLEQAEIKAVFDKQINKIIRLIDEQLESVQRRPTYLALSGGLGSSEYLNKRLREKYSPVMEIISADEPQQAVCKGLVIDRIQRLCSKGSMISRRSRAHYGIIFKERYQADKHKGQPSEKDKVDGKEYAHNQIKWLITAGEPVDEMVPFKHSYERRVPYKTQLEEWSEHVVSYEGSLDKRPTWYDPSQKDVQVVLSIPFVWIPLYEEVRNGTVRTRSRHWWSVLPSSRYWKTRHQLRIFVLPADLRFELYCISERGERKLEEDGTVAVDWEAIVAEG